MCEKMMNCLIVLSILIRSLSTANTFSLMNICEEDVFLMKNSKNDPIYINSFFPMILDYKLPEIDGLYFNTFDMSDFLSKDTNEKFERYKSEYNSIVNRTYSTNDLIVCKSSSSKSESLQKLNSISDELDEIEFKIKLLSFDDASAKELYYDYLEKMVQLKGLLSILTDLINGKMKESFISKDELDKKLVDLIINSWDETSHIISLPIDDYYSKNLIRCSNYKSNNLDASLEYFLYLPFHNKKWTRFDKCFYTHHLPAFYQHK